MPNSIDINQNTAKLKQIRIWNTAYYISVWFQSCLRSRYRRLWPRQRTRETRLSANATTSRPLSSTARGWKHVQRIILRKLFSSQTGNMNTLKKVSFFKYFISTYRAQVLINAKAHNLALRDCREVLKLDPTHEKTLLRTAHCYENIDAAKSLEVLNNLRNSCRY